MRRIIILGVVFAVLVVVHVQRPQAVSVEEQAVAGFGGVEASCASSKSRGGGLHAMSPTTHAAMEARTSEDIGEG